MSSGDTPQDDFKWFGEGFEGFPKRLPEDTVEYAVFILGSKLSSDAQVRARLNAIQSAATDLSRKLLKDYIWQRESFALDLRHEDGLWALRGRTNYGDSVADEWLIVYLLRELSKQFKEAWIRVYDTDGEFLLIEAANALPRWLNPEIAENRVWLHEGKLKIIPLQQSASTGAKTKPNSKAISLNEAIKFITSESSKFLHSPLIEEEAFYRIRNYPNEIAQNLHHALVRIPRKLAYILHRKPAYISPATEAFYLRDPISLRPLQRANAEGLRFPPRDFVTASVTFTKVGYAQLRSQEFAPPKAWENAIPVIADTKLAEQAEMGMKVTCGFEMLVADPQNQNKKSVREIQLLLEDIESGEEELPSDQDISKWPQTQDDESWLDINFEDFEKELAGKKGQAQPRNDGGFGDKAAQENLRKMVERFEAFLNDDTAGPEGVEDIDEMDVDDDEDGDTSDGSSDGEDRDVSFDEKEFARMMREMMGMPADEDDDVEKRPQQKKVGSIQELDSDEDEEGDEQDEAEAIQDVMRRMEAELNEAGALNLDPAPRKVAAARSALTGKQTTSDPAPEEDDKSENGEVDVDFNLAKNMLESLKGQAGMAGPAGNMMGLMGVKFPRDEGGDKDVS